MPGDVLAAIDRGQSVVILDQLGSTLACAGARCARASPRRCEPMVLAHGVHHRARGARMTAAATFSEFISGLGFEPPAHIEPGRWTSFSTNGKRGDTAGRARLFPDGEGGIVHDWRSGESWTWQAKRDRPFTAQEARFWREKIERAKREAVAEREREAKETAARAARIWREAQPVDDSHPYLKSKGVQSHGVRIYRGPLALNTMKCDGALLVPARNAAGELVSLSFIAPSGEKRYLSGPRPPGCYFGIGKPEGTLCIAEGYATGVSIHEVTGHAVAVAFDAGNLEPAARALREKFPALRLIVCADDDAAAPGNPGITKATAAARAVGALIAVPDFGEDRPQGASDFNDLVKHRGEEAVQRAVANARAPEMPHAQPAARRLIAADVDGVVELVRGSSLRMEPYDWLWADFLARGKLHMIAGAPGTGKTTLMIALMATITSGGRWPDGSRASVGNVLVWSGEDDPRDTLLPRFAAMGGDPHRIFFVGNVSLDGKTRPFDPARDMDALKRKAERVGEIAMLGVDPIVNVVAGDSHKNTEVRRSLQPVVDLAAHLRAVAIGVSHFSKGTAGRDPVERVTGSVAFGALPRIIFGAAKRTDEQGGGRVLVRAKSNIGPDGGGFTYDLHQVEVPGCPGLSASQVRWGEPLEGAARELLAQAEVIEPSDEITGTEHAEQFLLDLLCPVSNESGQRTSSGRMLARDAKKLADMEGITKKALRRARERLKVKVEREGFGKNMASYWHLPVASVTPIHAQSCPQEDGARMGTNGGWGTNEEVVEVEP